MTLIVGEEMPYFRGDVSSELGDRLLAFHSTESSEELA